MSLKKTTLTLTTLLSAILLSACGGGNDTSKPKYSDGNDNANEFSFELFDSMYDSQAKGDGIKRITWTYSDGNVVLKQVDIVNKNTREGLDNEDLIILSDNFEGKQRKQDVDVEGNKIIFNIFSDTTNQKEYSMIEMQKVNLSGVDSGYFDSKTKTGIYTGLNAFNKIPSSAKFPKGSVCYIPKVTNSFAHFHFDKNDVSNQTSMKSWLDTYAKDSDVVRTESLKVGASNQYDSTVVVYKADLTELDLPYAAVDYKGKIYDADFARKGTKSENIDKSKTGGVDCTLVNKVAADFLQDQIVQYYR